MRLRRLTAAALMMGWGALTVGAAPQETGSEQPVRARARGATEPKAIPRTTGEIRVDGHVDEAAWDSALEIELPYEVNPGHNIEARVRTRALLLYDDRNLYAAFRCDDPQPEKIRARYSDRDRAFQDDFVGLVLDTFNDERRAFEFFANPLGVQMDLVQDDVNGNEDASWDAIWNSAGRLTEGGYEVEIAIPYTSLRFQRGEGAQTWGLDLVRVYPRERRFLLASNARDRNVSCYLCQVSKVVGFEGAEPGRNLEITPTLTAGRSDVNPSFPAEGLERGSVDTEPGLTARWGVTPNLTFSGTLNPDFSQVEADAARLDVNEQFALFFPEKRPFFLEGSDFFETPIGAVYTRTIAAPVWGAKLTGKEGRHAMGAIVGRDEPDRGAPTILVPGSQGSSFSALDREFDVGVLRYRRDIGRNSALGALFTSREAGDYHNRVLGIDTLLRPTDADTLRIQLLGSQTRYPESVLQRFRDARPDRPQRPGPQPEGQFEDAALRVTYLHRVREWGTRASYEYFGDDFRADLGFVPQVDFRRAIVGGWYTWWQEPGKKVAWYEFGGDWDITEDQNGELIEQEIEANFLLSGPKQSFVIAGGGQRTRRFNDIDFQQNFVNTFGEVHATKNLYLRLRANFSHRVDFAYEPAGVGDPLARQGREYEIGPGLRYTFGRHLRLDLDHRDRRLDSDAGLLFRARLTELRLVHQFSVRLFARAIVQFLDLERSVGLYPHCGAGACNLEPEMRDLFGQFLLSYKLNPQTAIFVGYTDSRLAHEDTRLVPTGRTLFLKLSYAWVM